VVLEPGDEDLIARPDEAASPRIRDEVDRLGGTADEDTFVDGTGVEEATNRLARGFIGLRRARGEFVRRAVDIRVLVGVERG